MGRRYCPNCRQYVNGKKFNWVILILLLVFLFPIGLIYGAYCTFRKPRCPICKCILHSGDKPPETPQPQPVYTAPVRDVTPGEHQINAVYCPKCGKKCSVNTSFCDNCGQKL